VDLAEAAVVVFFVVKISIVGSFGVIGKGGRRKSQNEKPNQFNADTTAHRRHNPHARTKRMGKHETANFRA